jgi:hypothetical protein
MSTCALRSILSLLTFVILNFSGCYKAVQYYWLWAVRFCCNWWGWTTETSTAWEIVYFYSFWKGKKGRIIDGLLTYILMRTPGQKLMLHLHCSICIKHSLCIFSALVSIFFFKGSEDFMIAVYPLLSFMMAVVTFLLCIHSNRISRRT